MHTQNKFPAWQSWIEDVNEKNLRDTISLSPIHFSWLSFRIITIALWIYTTRSMLTWISCLPKCSLLKIVIYSLGRNSSPYTLNTNTELSVKPRHSRRQRRAHSSKKKRVFTIRLPRNHLKTNLRTTTAGLLGQYAEFTQTVKRSMPTNLVIYRHSFVWAEVYLGSRNVCSYPNWPPSIRISKRLGPRRPPQTRLTPTLSPTLLVMANTKKARSLVNSRQTLHPLLPALLQHPRNPLRNLHR